MIDLFSLFAAWMTGLVGSLHCVGMCGGVSSALQLSIPQQKRSVSWMYSLLFNLGRILSYALIGALAGWLSLGSAKALGMHSGIMYLRVLGAIFLLLIAAYVGRWWLVLSKVEELGAKIFNPLKSLGKRLIPLKIPYHALLLGMAWGWMPCGLVYSSLAFAATSASALESALRMFAFGLGTLPTLLIMGQLTQHFKTFLQQNKTKQIAAILLVVVALWTLYPLFANMNSHTMPSNMPSNMPHEQMNHS